MRDFLNITLLFLAASAIVLALLHIKGYRLLSVQTTSMLPTIRPEDALVITPVTAARLRVGDIVSYQSPHNLSVVISHRLVNINKQTGWLTTQGDSLNSPDPVFPPELVVGRATAVAPQLGQVLDAIREPLGLTVAIYVPAALLIASETRRLALNYVRPFYSARL